MSSFLPATQGNPSDSPKATCMLIFIEVFDPLVHRKCDAPHAYRLGRNWLVPVSQPSNSKGVMLEVSIKRGKANGRLLLDAKLVTQVVAVRIPSVFSHSKNSARY